MSTPWRILPLAARFRRAMTCVACLLMMLIGASAAAAPAPFAKIRPTGYIPLTTSTPQLSWQPSAGATSYEYCVQTDVWDVVPANTQCSTGWVATTQTTVTIARLQSGRLYGWQVRANGNGQTYADSGAWAAFFAPFGGIHVGGVNQGDLLVYNSRPDKGGSGS